VSLRDIRYVALDTELTSLDSRSNRLLSVGGIAMDGCSIRISEQFYAVVNPGVAIPDATVVIHGLRPHDVAEGDSPLTVLTALHHFVGDAVLVGHFTRIDLEVIRKELRGSGIDFSNPAIDTLRVHRWLDLRARTDMEAWDDRAGKLDLPSVAPLYGVDVQEAHHALYDAFITAQLWQKLIPRVESAGVSSVRDLLRIAAAR